MVSMTGYGRGEVKQEHINIVLEIKSVNHKYLDIMTRVPPNFWRLEPLFKEKIKEVIHRGRVEVYINLNLDSNKEYKPIVDADLALAYLQKIRSMAGKLDIKLDVDFSALTKLPEVIRLQEKKVEVSSFLPLIEQALVKALKRLLIMREAEGKKLAADIRERLNNLQKMVSQISEDFIKHRSRQENTLKKRLQIWLKSVKLEEQQDIKESIFQYFRSDITEEVVRMRSHIDQFSKFIKLKGAVGKRLDFLVQEMNREINTMGAKIECAKLKHKVVLFKEELEKIREQIQNLE